MDLVSFEAEAVQRLPDFLSSYYHDHNGVGVTNVFLSIKTNRHLEVCLDTLTKMYRYPVTKHDGERKQLSSKRPDYR